jgi:hypothetical protein
LMRHNAYLNPQCCCAKKQPTLGVGAASGGKSRRRLP